MNETGFNSLRLVINCNCCWNNSAIKPIDQQKMKIINFDNTHLSKKNTKYSPVEPSQMWGFAALLAFIST